ncbi:MAG: dihydroorotase [Spirochaetaceae bacterium 4572_59]|nr:MAG: dihydroorotase [Spirochaetaceae bacterium 4572_59]
MKELTIRRPDDFHLHLRQGENMKKYAAASAASFSRALIMPNILPPVCDPAGLKAYRDEIQKSCEGFTPLMTFKILPHMKAEDIKPLKEAGALAGKLYPAGVTTNAEDGISSLDQIRDVLFAMEEEGLVLSIHGEDPNASILEREIRFLPQLEKLVSSYGKLKIVFEHISRRESLLFLNELPERVAGTITAHHLLYTLDDLMGAALKPHLFCKPVVKTEEDRQALAEAVLNGHSRLFFGSDSAPHLKENKENAVVSAGVFTSPILMPLLADFFEREGCLSNLEAFVSERGASFYGLPLNRETLTLRKESWMVPDLIGGAVPLLAGTELFWRVLP